MKLKYMLLIMEIIVIGVIIFMIIKKRNYVDVTDEEIGDIKYFSMFYTKGYMMNADIRYNIEYDEEKKEYFVSIKPHGVSEEDSVKIVEPKELREKIKNILMKYDVGKWNGFNKSNHGVLDGDSFSLYVRFSNEKTIDASGYMSWPENYRNVRDEMDELFMNIYNKEKGIKEDE